MYGSPSNMQQRLEAERKKREMTIQDALNKAREVEAYNAGDFAGPPSFAMGPPEKGGMSSKPVSHLPQSPSMGWQGPPSPQMLNNGWAARGVYEDAPKLTENAQTNVDQATGTSGFTPQGPEWSPSMGWQGPPMPDNLVEKNVMGRFNKDQLSGLRNIAEGLGGIRAWTAGHILHGVEPPEGAGVAEDIRKQELELEDRLKPAELEYYRSMGIPLPDGAKKSDLQGYMGGRTLKLRDDQIAADQESDMVRQMMAQRSADARLEETQKNRASRERLAMRPTESTAMEMVDDDSAIEMLGLAIAKKSGVDTGPVKALWQKYGARFIGNEDEKFHQLASLLGSALRSKALEYGGKSFTAHDAKMLEMTMPTMEMNDHEWMAKAKEAYKILRRVRGKKIKALQMAGRDTSGMENWTVVKHRKTGQPMATNDLDDTLNQVDETGEPVWDLEFGYGTR